MKLLFSEATADTDHYVHPYAIWAFPEPGDHPADFFAAGFLPSSPELNRFYLCRSLRVELSRFEPSSENRRILRKGEGISAELIPRAEFPYAKAQQDAWVAYADARFGEGIMSRRRLGRLMESPVISHLLQFSDQVSKQVVGTVLLFLAQPKVAFYYYAFYDLAYPVKNLGMLMMTRAAVLFREREYDHLYLGTCYTQRSKYKTQFAGVELFNGLHWSQNRAELDALIQRDRQRPGSHLLEDTDYLTKFHAGDLAQLAENSPLRMVLKRPG